jgi:RNA 2',3'-cyclic 3'-phosphodiesterase
MRVFVGIDLDDAIRGRMQLFLDGVREFAPQLRWVRPESLHLTLKFIGEKPSQVVEEIKGALSAIHAQQVEITLRGYGFFPTARAPRVFWIGIESRPGLAALAQAVDQTTAGLGIAQEERGFSPHLTLARGGRGSGAPQRQKGDHANKSFQRLQEKLAALSTPEFGSMTAREFFLYESQLSRAGSRYTKIARFELY